MIKNNILFNGLIVALALLAIVTVLRFKHDTVVASSVSLGVGDSGPAVTPTDTPIPTAIPTATPTPTPVPDTTAPQITITAPANNAVVPRSTIITISADASDNVGVTQVQMFVNGTLLCTDATAPYACSWAVPAAKRTAYTLTAKAFDAAGNTATNTVTVTSSNK